MAKQSAKTNDGMAREGRRFTYYIKAAETVQRALTEPHLKAIGVTYVQLALLLSISKSSNMSAADLARRIGITPQSVGEVIAALLRKNYISRTEDDATRRVLRLSLLPAGEEVLAKADVMLNAIEAEWTRGIDPEALRQAKVVLGQLIDRPHDPFPTDHLFG